MDIEEFINQDIAAFLDTYAEKQDDPVNANTISSVYITRDYEKELFDALDHNNLVSAKKVLRDLKGKFDECPNGTRDKQQLKVLLTDLYEKFKDHIDSLNTFSKMESDIHNLASSPTGIVEEKPEENLDMPPPPPEELRAVQTPREDKPVEKHVEKKKKVHKVKEKRIDPTEKLFPELEKYIHEENVQEAMCVYREIRAILAKHSDPAAQERAVKLFESIKELMEAQRNAQVEKQIGILILRVTEQLKEGNAKGAATTYREIRSQLLEMSNVPDPLVGEVKSLYKKIKEHAHPSAQLDRDFLLQMESEKKLLDRQLQKGKVDRAMRTYKRMRVLAQQITNDSLAQIAAAKLVKIYRIINEMKVQPLP